MMNEFKREHRYLIAKLTDVDAALSLEEEAALFGILGKLEAYRKSVGKHPFDAVVVEQDWPEYEKVWSMIEERVSNEHPSDS